VADAERRGLLLAVNMNGRWAPPWRIATLLVEEGAVGDVLAVTHLYEQDFAFVPGASYDDVAHFVIADFSIHFVDIARCWLPDSIAVAVRAVEYRTPNQPPGSKEPWGAWISIEGERGESTLLRAVGGAAGPARLPFWIHGTEGTIRGSVEGDEFVELERDGTPVRFPFEGQWVPDGFAGTMGELITAIAESREPYNSARHTLRSLELTLAACRSADQDGMPVALGTAG
jgi:predicted dehydrogenase